MKNTIFECLERATLLNDKVAIVTGSAAGIGRACAHLFSHQGAKLVLVDINENGLNHVYDEINSSGGHAIAIVADITNERDIDRIYQVIMGKFGWINCLRLLTRTAVYF